MIGGHAGRFNTGTAGIAMIGDHTTTPVPDVVVDSAAQYVAWRFGPQRFNPRGTTLITGGPSSKYDTRVTVTVPRLVPAEPVAHPVGQLPRRAPALHQLTPRPE